MFECIIEKLNAELEVNKLGDYRKFKFVQKQLNSKENAIKFFIEILNYKKWKVNKIVYRIEYEKRLYQIKKNSYLPQ
ncbi:hypothetical protein [Acholeplasma hippikon]|nr:hypothetical protein [Acholeplasma hippikon]